MEGFSAWFLKHKMSFLPCNKEENNAFNADLLRVGIQEKIQSAVTLFYSFLHYISVFPSCIITFLGFMSKVILQILLWNTVWAFLLSSFSCLIYKIWISPTIIYKLMDFLNHFLPSSRFIWNITWYRKLILKLMSWTGLYKFFNYLDISWGKKSCQVMETAYTAQIFSNF